MEEAPAPAWFEECGEASAVGFEHVSRLERAEEKRFPEIMGGGVALCDLEGDGDLDLYLVQSGDLDATGEEVPGNRLYANDGSGHFEDATGGSGADDRGGSQARDLGALWARLCGKGAMGAGAPALVFPPPAPAGDG